MYSDTHAQLYCAANIAQITNIYVLSQCTDECAVCINQICRNINAWDKQSTIIWRNRNLDKY